MSQDIGRTFDQTILSAWQERIEAIRNPSIKQQCSQQEPELLPHFAEHYQVLKALRRRVRRSLRRQWKRSLAGLALFLAVGPGASTAYYNQSTRNLYTHWRKRRFDGRASRK
jgi:hypothetical protein